MNCLFICEGNIHRSPTAERLYATTPGIEARSAGLSDLARVQVTDELLAWADVVFIMERRLKRILHRRFQPSTLEKKIVCLNIPDDFQFQQLELITLLTERLSPYLGIPSSSDEQSTVLRVN